MLRSEEPAKPDVVKFNPLLFDGRIRRMQA